MMLQLCELAFDYQELPLLQNINLQLDSGDLLHVHGANGAGKTTLLKLIAGLYHPLTGEINYQGQSIHTNLAHYQRDLCFVGHKTGISPYLTIKENCSFDVHYHHRVDLIELSSVFKLDKFIHFPCGVLSSGQKRQVGLLRLWLSDASIWLLDEPFVALDEQSLAVLMSKIKNHREKGGMVILTSHQNVPLEKATYKDYFL
jgi:heme exporter protein A